MATQPVDPRSWGALRTPFGGELYIHASACAESQTGLDHSISISCPRAPKLHDCASLAITFTRHAGLGGALDKFLPCGCALTNGNDVMEEEQLVGSCMVRPQGREAVNNHPVKREVRQQFIEVTQKDSANHVHLIELKLDNVDMSSCDGLRRTFQDCVLVALGIYLQ